MTNGILKWDESGVLKHHCPICASSLASEKARSRCLGEHVEWCRRYHCLSRRGHANSCPACQTANEQHAKRHRDIATLLLQHRLSTQPPPPPPPALNPRTDAAPHTPLPAAPAPQPSQEPRLTRKARKAAKKAARTATASAANRPGRVVTTAEINAVAEILHPAAAADPAALDADPSIDVDAEVARVSAAFGLPARPGSAIACRLVAAVRDDLVRLREEQRAIAVQGEAFWRWAPRSLQNFDWGAGHEQGVVGRGRGVDRGERGGRGEGEGETEEEVEEEGGEGEEEEEEEEQEGGEDEEEGEATVSAVLRDAAPSLAASVSTASETTVEDASIVESDNAQLAPMLASLPGTPVVGRQALLSNGGLQHLAIRVRGPTYPEMESVENGLSFE